MIQRSLDVLGQSLAPYRDGPMRAALALGFGSGLPLYLVFSTLSFWLRESGVSRESIGYFSWVAMVYAIKFLWSPLVDGWRLPALGRLGRLRGWLLLSQLGVMAGLMAMAVVDPRVDLQLMALLAVGVALCSATQDIAVDAWRIERGQHYPQDQLASAYQLGYRLALIVASAGALELAGVLEASGSAQPWRTTYMAMAALMGLALLTTFCIDEPHVGHEAHRAERLAALGRGPRWLAQLRLSVLEPLLEFFRRNGRAAVPVLALICCYRLADVVLGAVANTFYVDMGFSKQEVASVTKLFGLVVTVLGVFIGGAMMRQWGVGRVMVIGAWLACLSNLPFAWLALQGHDLNGLIMAVFADNLAAGLATAAFVAYLSRLTHVDFSATQYALLSSLMVLLPRFIGGYSGWVVDQWGWVPYFVGTAALGLPVVWLAAYACRSLDSATVG